MIGSAPAAPSPLSHNLPGKEIAMRQPSRIVTSIALLGLCVAGCARRLDTTSPETVKTSLARMRASLPPEKLAKFNESVMVLAGSSLFDGAGQGLGRLLAMARKDPNQVLAEA